MWSSYQLVNSISNQWSFLLAETLAHEIRYTNMDTEKLKKLMEHPTL